MAAQDADPAELDLEEAVCLVEKKKASPRYQAQAAKASRRDAKQNADKGRLTEAGETLRGSKPLSGYQAFGKWRRQQLKEAAAAMSPPETMKQIASDWRRLPEAEKDKWKQSAKTESEAGNVLARKTSKSRTRKQPVTPYLAFCSRRRGELTAMGTNMKQTEIMSLLGKEWRGLSDHEKEQYRTSTYDVAT